MKRMLTLFAALSILFSCSDDKEDTPNEPDQAKLQGTWDATELKINDQTASDEAKFGKQILDHLTAKDCYIVNFTFNSDLTVVVENSAAYLDINVGGSGLDVPCPTESDTETSSYTFDGTTLTYVDADGMTISLTPTIEGNTMTIIAADLGVTNFDAEGELVFKKR